MARVARRVVARRSTIARVDETPHSAVGDTVPAEPTVPGEREPGADDGLLTLLQRAAIRSRMFASPVSVSVHRYVVLEHLGSGGMGDVFVAYDPDLDRKVALKVVRARAADDEEARARMLREAQAMARLAHPNVVTVHDVGVERGMVFVAMELVDGVTLRKWLESAPRWPRALEVVLAAGRGVAAAHAAGILHRDLKPDNIMVGNDGRARVMDFGLARAQGSVSQQSTGDDRERDAAPTELTRTGALMGTPAYMSPEQLDARSVDAKSDQFGFCVVLWEAVHGLRPFDGDSLPALAAAIQTGRPRLPERDRGVPSWLTAVLLRGLAADPAERFPSMTDLLDALEAGRGRTRRRRFAVAGAGVVALGLGGVALDGLSHRRAIEACDGEGAAIGEVWNDAASERLREAVLATGSAHASETHARALPWIEDWTTRWSTARRDSCLAASVEHSMASELHARSRACFDGRRDDLAAALDVFSAGDREVVARLVPAFANLPGPEACGDPVALARRSPTEHAETAELRRELSRADGLGMAGRYAEAAAAAGAVAEAAEVAGDRELAAQALASTGRHAQDAGELDRAEASLQRALEIAGPLDLADVATDATTELAYVVGVDRERHDAGLAWASAAAVFVAALGEEDGMRGAALAGQTGAIHFRRGDWAAAIESQQRALAIKERILGVDHPAVATSLVNVANAVSAQGEKARAAALYERALGIFEQALGPDHPSVATCANNLGSTQTDLGDYAAARRHLSRALAIREASFGVGHVSTASTLNNLASVQLSLGELDGARASFERSLAIRRASSGPDHPDVALALANLAKVERHMGRLTEAKTHQEEALAIRERALRPDHPDLVDSLTALAFVCFKLDELDRAHELYTRAVAIATKANGEDHSEVASALLGLADVARKRARHEEALALFERVVAMRDSAEVQPVDRGVARFALARALRQLGREPERARQLAVAAREELLTVGDAQKERIDAVDAFLAEE